MGDERHRLDLLRSGNHRGAVLGGVQVAQLIQVERSHLPQEVMAGSVVEPVPEGEHMLLSVMPQSMMEVVG